MRIAPMSSLLFATALLPLAPFAAQGSTPGGFVWSWHAGLGNSSVTLGDGGGQVLVHGSNTELRLFSSHDSSPPAPVWLQSSSWGEIAARESNAYLDLELSGGAPGDYHMILHKRSSSSAAPDWSYAFAPQFFFPVSVGISRDGSVIVSSFFDETTYESTLRIHDPETGVPMRTIPLPFPIVSVRLALSPDGSVAAVSSGSPVGTTSVIDLATGTVVHSTPGNVLLRQGLSEAGEVLVVQEHRSDGWHARVLARQGCCYGEVIDSPYQISGYQAHWAVSDDGSTVAGAFYDPTAPARFVVRAYDVPSASLTMERVLSVPLYDNQPTGVAINADGSRFVVGCWGDGNGVAAELAVYSPASAAPLVEYPQRGSVFSVDISPDGDRFVAARSPRHLGDGLNYTGVELYEFGGEDLVARGRPSIGTTVDFEFHSTPGANAFLLSSPRLAANPLEISGAGTLVLGRTLLESTDLGIVPPSGVATHSLALANDPALVGRTTWYQGLTTFPRRLSRDWVQLTVLP